MMNNKCWYNINIDNSNALREDWNFERAISDKHVSFYEPNELFNPNWLMYMHSVGLPVVHGIVFYRKESIQDVEAHIDIDELKNVLFFGVNWIYKGKDSEMIWYDLPKNFDINQNIYSTEISNALYCAVPLDNLAKIDSYSITSDPVLVRVDLPHEVKIGAEPRWCVSARIHTTCTNWEELTQHLLSKNLIN